MHNTINKSLIKAGAAFLLPAMLAIPAAHAEVLVLLPEHGSLAPAAKLVREGLSAAYYAGTRRPALRFVDSSDQPMDILLAKEVKPGTELVIGPLEREQVGELVNITPAVPVLALNEVPQTQRNVWQFALAPDEDATALLKQIQNDGVTQLYVYTEPKFSSGQRFRDALLVSGKLKAVDVKTLPATLTRSQGLLILGSSQWVSTLKLPRDRLYAPSLVFDRRIPLPTGVQFCDTPALLRADWPELNALNGQGLTSGALRLRAFGADAWQIAVLLLDHAPSARFAGRTGTIVMSNTDIRRTPVCFQATEGGLIPR